MNGKKLGSLIYGTERENEATKMFCCENRKQVQVKRFNRQASQEEGF